MKSIEHLSLKEQEHFILCDCGEYIDMRSLGEVFTHLHANIPEPQWSHSVKKGEPFGYTKSGERIELN